MISIVFVCGIAFSTGIIVLKSAYQDAANEICDLVQENYFLIQSSEGATFIQACRYFAKHQKFLFSKAANIQRMNSRLALIRTSHLAVYDPDENRLMWENQGRETGLRAKIIESSVVIHRIVPQSPAALAGVRPGDQVLGLNGDSLPSLSDIQFVGGRYQIRRQNQSEEMEFDITPALVSEDLSPTIRNLQNNRALLAIPSFLSMYFESEKWREISQQLKNYKAVIIDLRENPGGSFPGMLRAASSFICRTIRIGKLYQSSKIGLRAEADLPDSLDVQSQLKQLETAENIFLRTFSGYNCFSGATAVLVDSGTSSVAEIFAKAMETRAQTQILGQPTAGQVVMAKWFPVTSLGSGEYLLSIPIAGYTTLIGENLEGVGVLPQVGLSYDLERAVLGRDSWLEDAESLLSKDR